MPTNNYSHHPRRSPKGRSDSPRDSDRKEPRARRGRQRQLSVRSVRREQPDVQKIARSVIAMAMAQAEKDAQAAAAAREATDQQSSGDQPDEG